MKVHLTPELGQLVQARVKSGRHNSASEVVREAFRLLERRDEVFSLRKDEIRKRSKQDGEEVFDRIDKELEVMERSARK